MKLNRAEGTRDNPVRPDEVPEDRWLHFIRIGPGQTAMSNTLQMTVEVRCDANRFTATPFRHLVWGTRARHVSFILSPHVEHIPSICPNARDIFFALRALKWVIPLPNTLTTTATWPQPT